MSNISNEFSIPRRSFRRAVSEVTPAEGYKWSEAAIQLLQSASENELIMLMKRSNELANHAKRSGITSSDINLARKMGGDLITSTDLTPPKQEQI